MNKEADRILLHSLIALCTLAKFEGVEHFAF